MSNKRAIGLLLATSAFLALWLLLELFVYTPKAHAHELHITWHPPTVSGIEAAPSPAPFYQRGPVIRQAPSPAIYDLPTPAPGNACQRPAFEVISGPRAGRGCYGAQ